MKTSLKLAVAALALALPGAALAQGVVTVYSADGLHDGEPSWLGDRFDTFTKNTGIKVQFVEAGSSGVADRVAKEKANTQADILITLPPFIQKAAADGLLEAYAPPASSTSTRARRIPRGATTRWC